VAADAELVNQRDQLRAVGMLAGVRIRVSENRTGRSGRCPQIILLVSAVSAPSEG